MNLSNKEPHNILAYSDITSVITMQVYNIRTTFIFTNSKLTLGITSANILKGSSTS